MFPVELGCSSPLGRCPRALPEKEQVGWLVGEEGLEFCLCFSVGMTFFPLIYPVLVFKYCGKMKPQVCFWPESL